jgi:hypothetical protein
LPEDSGATNPRVVFDLRQSIARSIRAPFRLGGRTHRPPAAGQTPLADDSFVHQAVQTSCSFGQRESGFAPLRTKLVGRGLHMLVRGFDRGEQALRAAFRLVLGIVPLYQNNQLLRLLGNSIWAAFYCHPVEEGSWWLPIKRQAEMFRCPTHFAPANSLGWLEHALRDILLRPMEEAEILQEAQRESAIFIERSLLIPRSNCPVRSLACWARAH